jgi:ribosomal-protein-alanine N-acetyltransferase
LAGLVEWQSSLGGPVTLLGGVEKGNAASARVLEKAGFHLAMELSTEGTSMFRYEIPA